MDFPAIFSREIEVWILARPVIRAGRAEGNWIFFRTGVRKAGQGLQKRWSCDTFKGRPAQGRRMDEKEGSRE